jgi:hypothetical protein
MGVDLLAKPPVSSAAFRSTRRRSPSIGGDRHVSSRPDPTGGCLSRHHRERDREGDTIQGWKPALSSLFLHCLDRLAPYLPGP